MQTKREMTISESCRLILGAALGMEHDCEFWGKIPEQSVLLAAMLWSNFKALKCFPYFLITQVQN